ncbi:MAG: aspartyl protease family protein [Nitrososphaerales archaeon]
MALIFITDYSTLANDEDGRDRATVRLHGERQSEDVEMLVDTGALYTKISPSLARKLGIVPNEIIKGQARGWKHQGGGPR